MTKKRNRIPKTNWYKGTQKPVYEGPYLRLYPSSTFYCWFDKKKRKFGHGTKNPEHAKSLY